MISPLMVSSKSVKVSQKRCLRTSIESFAGSSLSEQIISSFVGSTSKKVVFLCTLIFFFFFVSQVHRS